MGTPGHDKSTTKSQMTTHVSLRSIQILYLLSSNPVFVLLERGYKGRALSEISLGSAFPFGIWPVSLLREMRLPVPKPSGSLWSLDHWSPLSAHCTAESLRSNLSTKDLLASDGRLALRSQYVNANTIVVCQKVYTVHRNVLSQDKE